VLLLKGKNQAFIQMADVIYATALVEFYTVTPAMIRYDQLFTHPFLFYKHTHPFLF
jgi:hypothetical protein